MPTVESESVIFHIGGAANDLTHDDGAVGNRDAHYVTGFAGAWLPGEDPAVHLAWVRDSWETIRPFSTGGNYVNFQLAEDDTTRTAEAYGETSSACNGPRHSTTRTTCSGSTATSSPQDRGDPVDA